MFLLDELDKLRKGKCILFPNPCNIKDAMGCGLFKCQILASLCARGDGKDCIGPTCVFHYCHFPCQPAGTLP